MRLIVSLESIDFKDFEPSLINAPTTRDGALATRTLVAHPLFGVDLIDAEAAGDMSLRPPAVRVVASVAGFVTVHGNGVAATPFAGDFCLLPAGLTDVFVAAGPGSRFLLVEAGRE